MGAARWQWAAMGAALLIAPGCSRTKAMLRKADSYMDTERYGAAVRTYEKVLERSPSDGEALLGMSAAWLAMDSPEKAITPAQVATEMRLPGAQQALVRALLANGRGAESRPIAEAAAQHNPDDHATLLLLSEARLAASDLSGATDAAEKTIMAKGGVTAFALAAWTHARQGNCGRAATLAGRAETGALDSAELQAEAAAVFWVCKDADRAQSAASTARTLQQQGPRTWEETATRLAKGGDTEGAIRRLSWLRAVYPEDGRYAWQLGSAWNAVGDWGRAATELTSALKLSPYSTGDSSSGVQVANRAADKMTAEQRSAAVARIWSDLAKARAGLNDAPGVAEALESAAREKGQIGPDDWMRISDAWARAGTLDRALAAAQEAVRMAPNHRPARAACARHLARLGQVDQAIGHGRVAWQADPSDADMALLLGALYERRGENREARTVYAATLERQPNDPRIADALRKLTAYQ